jgi:acyl dehydratase
MVAAPRKINYADLPSQIGCELGTSRWLEVTQERIDEFAAVTGDRQWMHVDVERAKREMGGTISHGLLIACLLPMLGEEIAQVTGYRNGFSYGFDKLRFTHPVGPGQRVRLKQTLHSVAEKNGGRLVTLRCIMEIEGVERPALVADYQALYYGD